MEIFYRGKQQLVANTEEGAELARSVIATAQALAGGSSIKDNPLGLKHIEPQLEDGETVSLRRYIVKEGRLENMVTVLTSKERVLDGFVNEDGDFMLKDTGKRGIKDYNKL